MYNGIGLTTPRGSGTNGYVQRNISFIAKAKEKINYRTEEDFKKLDALTNKKPNEGILAHERKRVIELKCFQLQETLEDEGFDSTYVESKVSELRDSLYDKDASLKHEVPKDDFGRPLVKESHQMAEASQEKNMKMREALGISQYFVEGSSLDPEHKAKEAAAEAAAQAEAQKKYTLVPDSSSSSSEKETLKEKPRKKKTLKKAEEGTIHKKKKTAKKDRRERSDSADEKRKKRSKRTLKDKTRHKRDKHHHRSNSSSSYDSDSARSSIVRDSSTSASSRNASNSSEISSSDDDRRQSFSKQKKKKQSTKSSKSQKEKKSSKRLSNSEGTSHHKDRKSRKDKYELSKKKKSSKESLKRVESSSDSSDADSHTEQYYRLEPVFIKSKSKHKKEHQFIDIQSKKRNVLSAYEKHEKKRKRKYSSSSKSEDDSFRVRKRHKHSSSPYTKDRHYHEKSRVVSDKHGERNRNAKKSSKRHHQKHEESSSDDQDYEKSNRLRSSSRSLSYSPLPNSRSTRHFSKKSIIVDKLLDDVPFIQSPESESQRIIAVLGGRRTDGKSASRRSKDSRIRSSENASISSDDSRVKDKHNGYSKSRVPQKKPSPSLLSKRRHDSSSSESDDYIDKKRSKKGKQSSLDSSPIRKKNISLSPPSDYRKKHKRNASSSDRSVSSDYTAKKNHEKKNESRKHLSPARRFEMKDKFNEKSASRRYHSRSRSNSPQYFKKSKPHYKNSSYNTLKNSGRRSDSSSSSHDHETHLTGKQSTQDVNYKRNKKDSSENSPRRMKLCKNNLELLKHLYETNHTTLDIKMQQKSKSKSTSPVLDEKGNNMSKSIDQCHKQITQSTSSSYREKYDMDNALRSHDIRHSSRPQEIQLTGLDRKNHTSNRDIAKGGVEYGRKSPAKESLLLKCAISRSRSSSHHSNHTKNSKKSQSGSPVSNRALKNSSSKADRSLRKEEHFSQSPLSNASLNKIDYRYEGSISPKYKDTSTKHLTPVGQNEEKRKDKSLSRSPYKVSRSSGSHSKSPAFEKSRVSRSRGSSRSSVKSESHSRSRSHSESKSQSRSPSDSRSHSRSRSRTSSHSKSRSRSRSKSYSSSSRSRSYSSRSHSRSAARSPSIPRRKGSPSFLDKRRITSARKRPVPYRRPSPPTPSSLTSRSSRSHSESVSPYSSRTSSFRSRSRSVSWSPLTRHKYEMPLTDAAR